MRSDSQSTTQADGILNLLQAAWPTWTPAPQLARISLQYSARIFALRRKGWQISNKVEIRDGVRHGSFRLGSRPVPRSSAPRAQRTEAGTQQNLIGRPEELVDVDGRYPD
jgi:hypothetical protein